MRLKIFKINKSTTIQPIRSTLFISTIKVKARHQKSGLELEGRDVLIAIVHLLVR